MGTGGRRAVQYAKVGGMHHAQEVIQIQKILLARVDKQNRKTDKLSNINVRQLLNSTTTTAVCIGTDILYVTTI